MVAGHRHQWRNGRGLVAPFSFCLLLIGLLPATGAADEAQRRILLIYSAHSTLVANAEACTAPGF
jgi:hypothetical protein